MVYVKDSQVDNDGRLTGGTVGINYVEAGNIFPTSWENKRVTECIFTFVKTYKRKRYILFQYHRLAPLQDTDKKQYVIENMVVEDTNGSGRELELEEWNQIPHFAGLAPQLETGSDQPMFVIDRLNIVNNVDADSSSPMGVALFSNAIDVLRKIDLEYDSYANEFSLGRKRIFVAPEFLSNVNGEPVFDPEDTVFYELPEDYFTKSGSKEAMREVNMELRVEEHSKAIQDDIKMLGKKCGFGTDRYVFENGQAKTATEVISENSDMYRSLQKHELILERVLLQLIQAIIHTGIQIGIPGLSEEAEILIHFDDSIIQDKEAERSQDRQDVAMGAMPLAEYRAKWYGETLEEAEKNLPAQDGGIIE